MSTLHAVCENPTLHEIHRGTIRAHHAKQDYRYPTIRLPSYLSQLGQSGNESKEEVLKGAYYRLFQTAL
jgi:hypothetical protein